MAVRQQSRIVRFESAAELLDTFGLSKGGKEYRRLISAFERIFGATIFFGTESNRSAAKLIHRSRFNFLSAAQIWYNRDPEHPSLSEEFANVVVLSEEFYREISDHPIPADLEAVKVLASAPAVLDLFVWLTYRCFSARGWEDIPLFGDFGLAHQLGCIEYSRPRRFRAMLGQWLASICDLWPQCPASISSDGRYLKIKHSMSLHSRRAAIEQKR